MKTKIIFFITIFLLASCTSIYASVDTITLQTSQTILVPQEKDNNFVKTEEENPKPSKPKKNTPKDTEYAGCYFFGGVATGIILFFVFLVFALGGFSE